MALTVREVALFGVLGGLTFAAKVAMAALPNIEPVSLMVMLFAVTFGIKAVFPIYIYVLMEFLLYGFNLWSINYLYIWAILAIAAWLLRRMTHPLGWALLSILPRGELDRVSEAELNEHYREGAFAAVASGGTL